MYIYIRNISLFSRSKESRGCIVLAENGSFAVALLLSVMHTFYFFLRSVLSDIRPFRWAIICIYMCIYIHINLHLHINLHSHIYLTGTTILKSILGTFPPTLLLLH